MANNANQIEVLTQPDHSRLPVRSGVAVRPILMVDARAWQSEPGEEDTQVIARRFHTQRVLGEGGMAVVKEVFDTNLLRSAAVKMVKTDMPNTQKARQGQDRSILNCSPKCDACTQLVMQGKPAFCPKWRKEKRAFHRALFQ